MKSNSAVRVVTVAEESPAFFADIFAGDYILSIAGESTYSQKTFGRALDKNEGQEVEIRLVRDGIEQVKTVQLKSF